MTLRLDAALAQFAEQGRAVHLRHHHVGDDEVDLAADARRRRRSASTPRGRLEHRIAARRQRAGAEGAHRLLVLDQQDRAVPRSCVGGAASCAWLSGFGSSTCGSIARECAAAGRCGRSCPCRRVGIAVDEAAGLLDDAVDHRQAEARALADLLGGEERLEDLVAALRRGCRCRCRRPRPRHNRPPAVAGSA